MTLRGEIKFLLQHSAVYGVGVMLSRLVAFVLLPLYTRYLTPADYGVLELIGATSSLVGIALGLGVTGALVRFHAELAAPDRRGLISTVYALSGLAAVLAFIPCMMGSQWLATVVLDGEQYTRHFQIGFATLLTGLISDIGMAYLRLLYRSTAAVVVGLANLVITVFLNVFLIVWLHFGVLGVLTGNLIGQLVTGLPVAIAILYRTGFHPEVRMARAILAYTLPTVPSELITVGAAHADRFFVRYFVSIADTGVFGLAVKVCNSLHLLITSLFMLTFMPRRFEIAQQPEAKSLLARIYDLHLAALLIPATLLAIFVREILIVMTTPPYYRAGDLVPILLLQFLVVGSKYHLEFGILHSKQTKYYLYVNGITQAVHVTVGLFLVRAFGIWGAAFAGLTSRCLQSLLLHLIARRLFYIPFDFVRNARALCVAAATVGLARLVPTENLLLSVSLKGCLGSAAVLTLLWIYRIRVMDIVRLRVSEPSPSVASS